MLGSYGVRERYIEARRACSGQPPPACCAICNGNYNLSAGALARDGTKVRDFIVAAQSVLRLCRTRREQDVRDQPGAWIFRFSVRAGAYCDCFVG